MFWTHTEATCDGCGKNYPVKVNTSRFSEKTFAEAIASAEKRLLWFLHESHWRKLKGRLYCNVCVRRKKWLKKQ